MSARYTVFCRRHLHDVTPEQLLAGTREADLRTIAEDYDLSDGEVTSALRQLRIASSEPSGFRLYKIHYAGEGLGRPVEVERWQTPQVPAVVAEAMLDVSHDRPTASQIEAYLVDTIEVVSIACSSLREDQFASILASEAARWLATTFRGVVRGPDRTWWSVGKNGAYEALGR